MRNSCPWLGVVVTWGAAFCVSCHLSTVPPGPPDADDGRSVAGALLGGSRIALGGRFYKLADLYFHKGVAHEKPVAFNDAVYQRAQEQISPRGHVHTDGRVVHEIMPWLWLATKADPHNVDTYLVAAFWLATEGGEPDVALDLLRRAQAANPFSYRIQLEKGRILVKEARLAEAADAFAAALAFWPGDDAPDSEEALYDKRNVLLHQALLHEVYGRNDEAIAKLEQVLELFPHLEALHKRIHELREGHEPSVLAAQLMRAMFSEVKEARMECSRQHGDHAEHEHGPDCGHDAHDEQEHEHQG